MEESERNTDKLEKLKRDINWVATESVGKKRSVVEDYKNEALGGITLTIEEKEVEFLDYWKKLRPKLNNRNIWFDKFWEQYHDCSLKKLYCNRKQTMSDIFSKIHPTIQGVYAFAVALDKLQKTACRGRTTICQSMKNYDGKTFFDKYLTKVNLTNHWGISNRVFKVGQARGTTTEQSTIATFTHCPRT